MVAVKNITTKIHTYIHMYLHSHGQVKINWNVFLLKKKKKIKMSTYCNTIAEWMD